MLRISGCQEDAIMLLLKPGPRSEFRIPITNLSSVKASCEFKILPGGMNSDMHTFFIMPFRYVILPGETIRVVITIKYNVQLYNNEQFRKRTEMRKLLAVKLKDTSLNIAFPLLIKFAKTAETTSSGTQKTIIRGAGKEKLMSLLANFKD
jgi:hypothetical protein